MRLYHRPIRFLLASLGICLASNALAVVDTPLIPFPLINPGAEAGDLSGWSSTQFRWGDNDYSAIDDGNAYAGSRYFALDTSVIGSADSLPGSYQDYSLTSVTYDLGPFAGHLDDIAVYAQHRNGNLTLNLEVDDGAGGSKLYDYPLFQDIGVWLKDASGEYISGLSWGHPGTNVWEAGGGNFSWWSEWEAKKDEISEVEIWLASRFDNFDYPALDTLDRADLIDAYFSWEDASGNYHTDEDLSWYGPSQQPIIGFDDVRMELTISAVPIPPAAGLFGAALIGLIVVGRRHNT